jgi:alkylated DNA repair protein alkB family protein 6
MQELCEMMWKKRIPPKCPNHILLNEYESGIGIMPHTDGPAYYPYVTILSLMSHCVFEFFADFAGYKDEKPVTRLLVEPNSILIFTGKAYSDYLHCIRDKEIDDIEFVFDTSGALKSSNIDNAVMTNLYQQAKAEFQNGKKAEETKAEGDGIVPIVKSLNRSTRISLTIRYVPEAPSVVKAQ